MKLSPWSLYQASGGFLYSPMGLGSYFPHSYSLHSLPIIRIIIRKATTVIRSVNGAGQRHSVISPFLPG